MREIKFRGKRIDNGEWVYGGLIFDSGYHRIIVNVGRYLEPYPIECKGYTVKSETVGQFTGLKDKNGVEIYEGDIVKIIEVDDQNIKEYLTPVIFDECAFLVQSGKDDYDTFLSSWCGNPNTTYPLFEIGVICNIY
jgi:uncharacterized phage protein (TIGR01671 family)